MPPRNRESGLRLQGWRTPTRAVALGVALMSTSTCASGGSATPDTGVSRDTTLRVHNAVGARTIDISSDTQERTNYVLKPVAEVWALLPTVFEQMGVEVGYADPATHTMGNAGVELRRLDGQRLSRWLDCGYGTTAQANADTYTVNLSLLVTLGDLERTGTEVVTRFEATAKPREHSGHPVPCTSRGTLEPHIAELLQKLADQP